MPLPFCTVCDLLEKCHQLCLSKKKNTQAAVAWFARNRGRIDAYDTDLSALLSTLLPEKRTDRVYCIQAASLERVIARGLLLGASRVAELAAYKSPGRDLDLADCVERILLTTPNPTQRERHQITVEEIDDILNSLASRVKWSSPSIRAANASLTPRNRSDLEQVYRRLTAIEAKWFTRLVLKDYRPVILDSHLIHRLIHPVLPGILKIQDDFTAAARVIQAAKGKMLPNSARTSSSYEKLLASVKPKLGIKVGRQHWFKARSIKHSVDLGHGRMSVEDKLDGEYCQIHIDMSKKGNEVQIFSKSGKDSTEDRLGLHGPILDSLKIGQQGSGVRKGCILEGELLVYSDAEHKILPFHKIRKHVSRRGRFLNVEQDSQPKPWEHLMIVYYDILLLDDDSLLQMRHSERFKLLEQVIHQQKGQAELVQRQIIDFGHSMGASALRKVFARVIMERGEGLVLKPDDPYFHMQGGGQSTSARCIKLKKEYIGNFGDIGDFAVVGAGFHPAKAKTYSVPNLLWTHFYVGCIDNREEVKRWGARPEFTVVAAVELNETLLKTLVGSGGVEHVPLRDNTFTKLTIAVGVQTTTPLTMAFKKPLVFDLRCFSFDKQGNTGFWSPRFPCVTKIHFDRDYTDAISFEELQDIAKEATTAPELDDSQENLAWIAKLESADPRGIAIDAVSQLTATTMPTPSPQQRSQSAARCSPSLSPAASRLRWSRDRSPEKQRKPARGFAAPLITPPTSSAPAEPASSQSPRNKQAKRRSPDPPPQSPACKRQKAGETRRRQPLQEVDGNASQNSPVSGTPAMSNQEEALKSTIEDSQGEEDIEDKAECVYSGADCRLSKSVILYSPECLEQSAGTAALVKAHGIQSNLVDVKDWMEAGMPNAALGSKTIMLVDSIDLKPEMQSLLCTMDADRKDMPDECDLVTIYDWRVLEYLTIMEDESITKKYYDGFCDPWRRWYCGII